MKKTFIIILSVCLLMSLFACTDKTEETTVCGGLPPSVIISEADLVPFTEEEIVEYINKFEKEFLASLFPKGSFISSDGYYDFYIDKENSSFMGYTMFIVNGEELVGTIQLYRRDGRIYSSIMDGWAKGTNIDVVEPTLKKYGKGIMVSGWESRYFVTEDNKIHVISGGVSEELASIDNVYQKYATEDNIIEADKVFGDCMIKIWE